MAESLRDHSRQECVGAPGRGRSELKGAEFHKQYSEDVDLEFEKASALYELSGREGFSAPRPLRVDQETNTIVYAALTDLQSIRDVYLDYVCGAVDDQAAINTFFESGRVLAAIHRELQLSNARRWESPERFSSSGETGDRFEMLPMAFLHGDYGFANVFVGESDTDLIVLDASPNYFVTFSTNCYGPVYLDIGNMLSCMDGLVPWAKHLKMQLARVRTLESAFVSGYESDNELLLDKSLLTQFTEATSLTYLEYRLRSKILGRIGYSILYNPVRRSLIRPISQSSIS